MAKKKFLPDFDSEEEELEFWTTHRIEDYETEPVDDIHWNISEETKKRVTLRLQPSLIDELKEFAAEVDLPYQTLTRALIRRGLEQARRERDERQAAVEAGQRE